MNLCFLTTNYNTPTRGGVEGVTCRLLDIFREKGHQVFVVCANNKTDADEVFPDNTILPDGLCFSQININYLYSFLFSNKVSILINQSECESIEKLAYLMKQRIGLRLLSTIHFNPKSYISSIYDELAELKFKSHYFSYYYKLLKSPITLKLREIHFRRKFSITYNHSDAVVLLSKGYEDSFIEVSKLSDHGRLRFIPNPISIGKIPTINSHEKIIVWCGRLTMTAKRPDRMIMIWEQLCYKFPDWHLYILGDGDFKETLFRYCNNRNIHNVHFEGRVEPFSYYMKASILCSTSSSEGFPLVLLEALQYGIIPCAFRWNDSVDDIIDDGATGFVIDNNNLDSYISRLSQLMNNQALREKMYSNIKRINIDNQFGENRIYQLWQTLFNYLKNQ